MEDQFSFAQRLVEARTARGWKQKDLIARLEGPAQSTISKWETGQSLPSADDIRTLARVLGCTGDYLLGLSEQPTVLRPGDWIIDEEGIERALADASIEVDLIAWPIPNRHRILSSSEWKAQRAKVQKERRGKK